MSRSGEGHRGDHLHISWTIHLCYAVDQMVASHSMHNGRSLLVVGLLGRHPGVVFPHPLPGCRSGN